MAGHIDLGRPRKATALAYLFRESHSKILELPRQGRHRFCRYRDRNSIRSALPWRANHQWTINAKSAKPILARKYIHPHIAIMMAMTNGMILSMAKRRASYARYNRRECLGSALTALTLNIAHVAFLKSNRVGSSRTRHRKQAATTPKSDRPWRWSLIGTPSQRTSPHTFDKRKAEIDVSLCAIRSVRLSPYLSFKVASAETPAISFFLGSIW
jgi:hypothetical protein